MIGPIWDFPYLLEQVSPHMSEDKTLPEFQGVFFEARDGYLYAVATNRYTLAVSRRELEDGPDRPWSALVPADALKSVRAFTNLNRHAPLYLDCHREMYEDILVLRAGQQALEVLTFDGELPPLWSGDCAAGPRRGPWRQVVADAVAADADMRQEVHLSPGLLALWGSVSSGALGEPLTVWTTGSLRPLVIACGPDFLGLQMPINVQPDYMGETASSIREQWADSLSNPPSAAKAA